MRCYHLFDLKACMKSQIERDSKVYTQIPNANKGPDVKLHDMNIPSDANAQRHVAPFQGGGEIDLR